jgi:hypothetical protein
MGVATARQQNKKAAISPHLSDEDIMQLVFGGTQRGRPENPQVPDSAILSVVESLMRQRGKRVGVSIATISNHLPTFSYYDVHKSVLRLIGMKVLRRCNVGRQGESAKIILGRLKRR